MTHRMHVALNVADLERSRTFYEQLFDLVPDKVRRGYVRFQLPEPALTLSLNLPGPDDGEPVPGTLSHLGIRLSERSELEAVHGRLKAAGYSLKEEEGTNCCYAIQDKFWIQDPDGNSWEYYLLLDDAPEGSSEEAPEGASRDGTDGGGCCPE